MALFLKNVNQSHFIYLNPILLQKFWISFRKIKFYCHFQCYKFTIFICFVRFYCLNLFAERTCKTPIIWCLTYWHIMDRFFKCETVVLLFITVYYKYLQLVFLIALQVKILYLKNLPPNLSSQGISVFLQAIVGNRVVKIFKMHNFCFIHFIDRKSAEEAMNLLQGESLL